MSEKQSAARELYDLFVRRAQRGRKGWSWVEFNGDANAFVLVLIRAGIEFTEEDATWFLGSWSGAWRPLEGFAESAYSAACCNRNDAARKAFAAALGRKPWRDWRQTEKHGWLSVGSQFQWGKAWATVNSFNDREERINVRVRPFGEGERPEHMARITHAEFVEAVPRPKKPKCPKCECGHGKKEHYYGRSCNHADEGTWQRCTCSHYQPVQPGTAKGDEQTDSAVDGLLPDEDARGGTPRHHEHVWADGECQICHERLKPASWRPPLPSSPTQGPDRPGYDDDGGWRP